jgi:hypothetical protein
MSSVRYLELNSSHRDRNQYPLPSYFVAEISQTGQKPKDQAKDPISLASPFLSWHNSFQETADANQATAISIDITYSTTGDNIYHITAAAGVLKQVKNFYNGAIFNITVGGVANVRRRIVAYESLNATNAIMTLESSLGSGAFGADGLIQNPTPIATNTANSVIRFFIPSGGFYDNMYTNSYIQSMGDAGTGDGESILITAYDGYTRMATLERATVRDWSSPAESAENFVIRHELPCNTGELVAVSGRVLQLPITANSNTDSYTSSFIRANDPVGPIIPPYGQEKRIVKYIAESGAFQAIGAIGTSTFTFTSDASAQDNYYVDQFITTSGGDTFLITAYNGTTKQGSVAPSTWTAGAATWIMRSATLQTAFTPNLVASDRYEIECYTRDNWSPFSYNGSLVSSQQTVCYEIELLNLILPNIALKSGSRSINYPFMYVRLQGISSNSGAVQGAIYSNNPPSNQMMFRAVIDDPSPPNNSPFIKIDSDGMVQVLKFKPNDSFKFGVYLPNGAPFETVLQDTVNPTLPNPLVQISALFSLKRV